jgi:hypothetical protein
MVATLRTGSEILVPANGPTVRFDEDASTKTKSPAGDSAAARFAGSSSILLKSRSWGLRPRLYSAVRFADSAPFNSIDPISA